MIEKVWKQGEYNKETDLYFWSYVDKSHTRARWLTKEQFEIRREKSREYGKKHWSKYYKKKSSYYQKNKEKALENGKKRYYDNKKYHPMYVRFNNTLINTKSRNKKGRNLEHSLKLEDAFEKFENQNGKCYYSGLELIVDYGNDGPRELSFERLDSNMGYTKENVVLSCKMLNLAKNKYSLEEFKLFFKELFNSKEFIKFINS